MNPFRRPKSPPLRTIRSADELPLANVSAVNDFALGARHSGETLLAFACDETDGPIQVFFGPTPANVQIDLATLRELLDRAEADLLRGRREWQEPEEFR